MQRFVGLQKHTGQKLLDLFQSYITAPHNTVRWRWREGNVAIWDKRLTQSANDRPWLAIAMWSASVPVLASRRKSRRQPRLEQLKPASRKGSPSQNSFQRPYRSNTPGSTLNLLKMCGLGRKRQEQCVQFD
nr:TauD/TfdA family dioxygenase [Bradyrhizobium australiense]